MPERQDQTLTAEQATVLAGLSLKFIGLNAKCEFSHIEEGPVLTGYFFKPDYKLPLSRIINKAEDFALAAKVDRVTISRLGDKVAIYVPNKNKKVVDFKACLDNMMKLQMANQEKLPLILGVDTIGRFAVEDLTEMPHVLMAGQTGAGKSVLEAAIISGLVIAKKPQEMQLTLIDTKKLDLPLFTDLPHVKSVITTTREFHDYFEKLLLEIRKRNDALSYAKVRKLSEYHTLIGNTTTMPYIVVVVDELADLIDQDNMIKREQTDAEKKPKIKDWLKQVAQIGRATGVHLICCTQRTSAKIIDGDIKVNLPCRIALRMPTRFDSVTILGQEGAENLLGSGDMLIHTPDSELAKRLHGPFVSMHDIQEILIAQEHIRNMYIGMRTLA